MHKRKQGSQGTITGSTPSRHSRHALANKDFAPANLTKCPFERSCEVIQVAETNFHPDKSAGQLKAFPRLPHYRWLSHKSVLLHQHTQKEYHGSRDDYCSDTTKFSSLLYFPNLQHSHTHSSNMFRNDYSRQSVACVCVFMLWWKLCMYVCCDGMYVVMVCML